jgi:hypothetical protein
MTPFLTPEGKGRRSFDTAVEYETMGMIAQEKTRTTESVLRATPLEVAACAEQRALATLCAVVARGSAPKLRASALPIGDEKCNQQL